MLIDTDALRNKITDACDEAATRIDATVQSDRRACELLTVLERNYGAAISLIQQIEELAQRYD